MSRVKNISGGRLDVPLLNRSVEDGEVVDVPDFQPAHTDEEPLPIEWPHNRWQPVTDEEFVAYLKARADAEAAAAKAAAKAARTDEAAG